jgi:hypothetical protein
LCIAPEGTAGTAGTGQAVPALFFGGIEKPIDQRE